MELVSFARDAGTIYGRRPYFTKRGSPVSTADWGKPYDFTTSAILPLDFMAAMEESMALVMSTLSFPIGNPIWAGSLEATTRGSALAPATLYLASLLYIWTAEPNPSIPAWMRPDLRSACIST